MQEEIFGEMFGDRYKVLVDYIGYFNDSTIRFYELVDGVPIYDSRFSLFVEETFKSGIMTQDYLERLHQLLGNENKGEGFIENADIDTTRALLTYFVQGERFCKGFWQKAIDDGSFLQVLHRLKLLVDVD